MRIIIVGDIHGQSAQFDRLLKCADFSPDADKLILLGDLIDRGEDSYGVIHRVMCLKEKMGSRLVILRGSHERLLLSVSLRDRLLWRLVGKSASVRSFKAHGESLSDYAGWIRENTVLYHTEPYFQCAHAAVKIEPISENDEHTLMMDHFTVKKNRYAGKLTLTGHIHLGQPTFYDGCGGKGIFLPYQELLSLPEHGVICLDTGCGKVGRSLTGMVTDGKRYRLISVP